MVDSAQITAVVRSMNRAFNDAAGLPINMAAGPSTFLVGEDDAAYTDDLFQLIADLKADNLGFGAVSSTNAAIIKCSSRLDFNWSSGQLEIPDGFIIDFLTPGGFASSIEFSEASPSSSPLKLSGGATLHNINFRFSGASPELTANNEVPTLVKGSTYQVANVPMKVAPSSVVVTNDGGATPLTENVDYTLDREQGRVTYLIAVVSPTVTYTYKTVDAIELDQTSPIGGVPQAMIDGLSGGIEIEGDDWRNGIRVIDSGAEAASVFLTALLGTNKPLFGLSLDLLADTTAGGILIDNHQFRRVEVRSTATPAPFGGFWGAMDKTFVQRMYMRHDFAFYSISRGTFDTFIQETPSGDSGLGQLFFQDCDVNIGNFSSEFLDLANVGAFLFNVGERTLPVELKAAGPITQVVGAATVNVGPQAYGLTGGALLPIDLEAAIAVYENGVQADPKDYVVASSGVISFRSSYGITTPVTMDYFARRAHGAVGGNVTYIASDDATRIIFAMSTGGGGGGLQRGDRERYVCGSASPGIGIFVGAGTSLLAGNKTVSGTTLHSLGGESVLETIAVSDFGGVTRVVSAAGYWDYIEQDVPDMPVRAVGGADSPAFGEFIVASGSGPYTITLPLIKESLRIGQRIRVANFLSSTLDRITVAVDSGGEGDTLDTFLSLVELNQYDIVEFVPVTGTNWAMAHISGLTGKRSIIVLDATGGNVAVTAKPNTLYICTTGANVVTINLPALAGVNEEFIERSVMAKKVDAGGGTVDIDPDASDSIEGGGAGVALQLVSQWDGKTLWAVNTNTWILE